MFIRHALVRPLSLARAAAFALALSAPALAQESAPKTVSPDDFVTCTDRWSTDDCLAALRSHVRANPGRAFEAGKAVTQAAQHWTAIPFFATALDAKTDTARCSDQRLALAVTSALGLPNEGKEATHLAAAKKILTAQCWSELRAPVLKAVDSGVGELPGNVCPILAEKKESSKGCQKKVTPAPTPPTWQALDPKTLDVEGSARVFRGEQGRKVTLVKVKGKDYYLIKFEGFRGPWNGKVVLHREEDMGRGYNYWTQVGKNRHISFVSRRDLGSYTDYEVYPRGDKGPYHLGYDETLSKAANPKAVLAELPK